jgi:Asp-tRNA(Asn)/Glu-tRNA(Gln) amidotransferase A subunit family amidase
MTLAHLTTLAQRLRTGATGAGQYLAELEALFAEREPELRAFAPEEGRFDRLRREAEVLYARFPLPDSRPPLFGVPVGIKDILHVDGMVTRAGSRLPEHELQGPESEAVSRLIAAGALVLGKTVSTEFAYFGPGPTRNPHNPDHTPGGSSSGSAAAVAAGLAPLALGTQTIGSIIRPAAFCGVVGFKPSYDRIPRRGVIPLAPSVDHVGVFAASAAGAALAASVLCDDWRAPSPGRQPVLGVPEGPYLRQASREALAHFRAICARLADAGYLVKAVEAMPDIKDIADRHNRLVAAEAARVHAGWFKRYRDLYHPRTTELIERGQRVGDAALARALEGRDKLRVELATLMDEHSLDLWLSPSAPGPAPHGLASTGDPAMNLPWTHAGLPAVSLPSGAAPNGLPLGLQLVGRWQADEDLLAWATELEPIVAGRHD